MQDDPKPDEILGAVARFLRDIVAAETAGHTAFNARVAANALEMMRRQLDLAPAAETAEIVALKTLLATEGDLATLNAELCRRLRAGEIQPRTPGLAAHLWTTTLAKLAVDQPRYWGYQAALADRAKAKI